MAYAGGYPPKRGAEYLLVFPVFDNDGDLVVGATGVDAEISKDGGVFNNCGGSVVELTSGGTGTGIYRLTLSGVEMTADVVAVQIKTTSTDAKTTPIVIYTSVSSIADIAGGISTLNGNVSTVQGDISTIQGDVSTVQGDISTIQGDVSTVQGDISTIQGDVSTVESNITTILNFINAGPATVVSGIGLGAISYTLEEMLDELGIYLNDLNQTGDEPWEFTETQKVVALNRAQDKVLQQVKNDYIVELHLLVESQALDTDLKFDLTTLTAPVFHKTKGLMGIKLHGGKFANALSFAEYRLFSDRDKTFSSEDPACFLRGNYVYLLGASTSDTIDIYYMREPVKMALDATGSHENDTSCELRVELQDVIIEYAAYILFKYGKDINRAKMALLDAHDGIDTLNNSKPTSDSITGSIMRNLEANTQRFDILLGR